MSERTNPHPARVGRAGGKSIRRARRCGRRKVVGIALDVVPLTPQVVAHAINVLPLGRDAVANPSTTRLLAFMPSLICARWSCTIQRRNRSPFLGTRCKPRLSRFQQMVTRTRRRTPLSGRVAARFDPRWANFVGGDRSCTAGAPASVAGRHDRIEWGRYRIEWGWYRTKWGRYRTRWGRYRTKCGRDRIKWGRDRIECPRDRSCGLPSVRLSARPPVCPLQWTPFLLTIRRTHKSFTIHSPTK
jgi:hypothetical protein